MSDFPNTSFCLSTYNKIVENDHHIQHATSYLDQEFKNFFFLFNAKNNIAKDEVQSKLKTDKICFYTDEEFNDLKFNNPIHEHHFWGSHQNPNYFYAHHRMMLFYLKNPNFDYYWFFDDDMTFDGDLAKFISSYDKFFYDFFAIQVFSKEVYSDFPVVPMVDSNMGSGGTWLSHAPGPGDNYLSSEIHMGSFFPIVRFSRRAFKFLLKVHSDGYFGYSEGFVPTTLASNGYSVASMLNQQDQYCIAYNENNVNLLHKGMPFEWSWI